MTPCLESWALAISRCTAVVVLWTAQLLRPHHLTDHRLDIVRQLPATTSAAGATRDQIRDHPLTLTPAPHQHVHLSPRNAQLRSRRIHRTHTHTRRRRQRPDHLSPPDGCHTSLGTVSRPRSRIRSSACCASCI